MSRFPTLHINSTIEECMEIIGKFESGISYILSKEKLVGIVTDGDKSFNLTNIIMDDILSARVTGINKKKYCSNIFFYAANYFYRQLSFK